MRRINRNRRGITAVLAMLYLALFATMALGFYATVTSAVQVARNEQTTSRSQLAAESGMAFIKYHLANLGVPPATPPDQLFQKVYDQLSARLVDYNGTMVIPGAPPTAYTGAKISKNLADDTIYIPGNSAAFIAFDDSASFRIVITKQQNGQQLRVKAMGAFNKTIATKLTQLDYAIAKDAAEIFNFGVASKSAISMNGNVSIEGASSAALGSVLSATLSNPVPLTMTGNARISGDVSFVADNPTLSIGSNATIAGFKASNPNFIDHVHTDVGTVPFPVIDTTAFKAFVPGPTATGSQVITSSNPSGTSFKNIRIKAGANPTFNANTTIQGVVYIESPNQVKFSGQVNLTGVIAVETPDPVNNPNNESMSLSANTLEFAGGVTFQGVEHLPTNNSTDFPPELRALTGSMLLAPGFAVSFKGNFGNVGGSIFGSQISYTGTAGGTVRGSVVNLRDSSLNMSGTADIVVESQGTGNYPAGVFFGSHYSPLPNTYVEASQ